MTPRLPVVSPSFLDRAIARVSPTAALRRYEARVRFEAASQFFGVGGYNGARGDRQATKNWTPALGSPDSDTIPDLPALRARCSDLERNDPASAGVMNTKSTHVVGTGIIPNARIDREFLGLSDEEADAWETQADRIFDWWATSRASDIGGRLTFYEQQELVYRGAIGRGDIFAVKRFVERDQDLLGLRVQLVEADRVCNPAGKLNSTTLVDGIVLDENGRPSKVYVLKRHPGDATIAYNLSRFSASDWDEIDVYGEMGIRVLQVYRQLRPNQNRGVPILAPVIETLKQLSRFSESELMASVVTSFFTVFVKSDTGDVGLSDLGDPTTKAAATATPDTARDVRMGYGSVVGLAPGEDVVLADPKRPNAAFDPFWLACMRAVGMAINMPYEIVIKHFSSSYSASRAAFLEFYRAVMGDRTWQIRQFANPCREWVLEEAIVRGLLKAPGFFQDPLVRAAYCACEWSGPVMGQLDPESEVNAAQKRMDARLTTLAEETAQLTGRDWLRNMRQTARERRTMQQLEIVPGPAAQPSSEPTPPPAAEPPTRATRDRLEAIAT